MHNYNNPTFPRTLRNILRNILYFCEHFVFLHNIYVNLFFIRLKALIFNRWNSVLFLTICDFYSQIFIYNIVHVA